MLRSGSITYILPSECVAAAAPMAAACAAALVEAGLNPIADLACFAAIAANIAVPVSLHWSE